MKRERVKKGNQKELKKKVFIELGEEEGYEEKVVLKWKFWRRKNNERNEEK